MKLLLERLLQSALLSFVTMQSIAEERRVLNRPHEYSIGTYGIIEKKYRINASDSFLTTPPHLFRDFYLFYLMRLSFYSNAVAL